MTKTNSNSFEQDIIWAEIKYFINTDCMSTFVCIPETIDFLISYLGDPKINYIFAFALTEIHDYIPKRLDKSFTKNLSKKLFFESFQTLEIKATKQNDAEAAYLLGHFYLHNLNAKVKNFFIIREGYNPQMAKQYFDQYPDDSWCNFSKTIKRVRMSPNVMDILSKDKNCPNILTDLMENKDSYLFKIAHDKEWQTLFDKVYDYWTENTYNELLSKLAIGNL